MRKFTKETAKRALRTFIQAAISYIVVNIVLVDFSGEKEAIKSALIGLLISALSAAISAVMNLQSPAMDGTGGMAKYRSPFKASSRQTTAFKVKGSWAAGYHTGVDRVCDSDRTLVSPANGTVQRNAYSDSYGYYVIITTDEGMSILMAHMKEKSPLKVGAKIKAGDPVGTMGSTGNSSGPHLHIEIVNDKTWAYNTKLLNPNDYIDWNDTKSVGTATGKTTLPTFKIGSIYTLTTNIKVRTGAGTNYAQKKRSQLTADGQKHAIKQTMAVLTAGTKITALEVKNVGNDIWLRIPSGWICGYYKGDIYAK